MSVHFTIMAILFGVYAAATVNSDESPNTNQNKPHIIVILADDMVNSFVLIFSILFCSFASKRSLHGHYKRLNLGVY